jgi:Flp pilus assembly protein TadG
MRIMLREHVVCQRNPRRRKGQAVVEFALVLPVFVLLVFGALEFGRAYFDLHLLTSAAREGARVGSLPNQLEADVQGRVDEFLNGVSLSGSWSTTITVEDQSGVERTGGLAEAVEGDIVYVTVSYDFQVVVGSLLPNFSGTVPLRGRCAFRRE